MDAPPNSRCVDCRHRAAKTCTVIPAPPGAALLRYGQAVRACSAYAGPDGTFTAIEDTGARVKLRVV